MEVLRIPGLRKAAITAALIGLVAVIVACSPAVPTISAEGVYHTQEAEMNVLRTQLAPSETPIPPAHQTVIAMATQFFQTLTAATLCKFDPIPLAPNQTFFDQVHNALNKAEQYGCSGNNTVRISSPNRNNPTYWEMGLAEVNQGAVPPGAFYEQGKGYTVEMPGRVFLGALP